MRMRPGGDFVNSTRASDKCSTSGRFELQCDWFLVHSYHAGQTDLNMLIRDTKDRPALAAVSVEPFRFRGWLRRRTRQLVLLVLICAGSLVLITCGAMIGRSVCLIGLPDVGDPFDVAAFRSFRIPEDQDAVVLLRHAAAKVPSIPFLPMAIRRLGPSVGWSQADPKLREWALANLQALEMFRQGADRLDGIPHPSSDWVDNYQYLNLRPLIWLALLEGARQEEQGDMAAAWIWYRTVLRMRVHVMRRGSVYQRPFVDLCRAISQSSAGRWF